MNEPKFTPGPWKAVLSNERQPQILYRGLVAVLERSPEQWSSVVAQSGYADAGRETIDANAHLIAAAPELFTALEPFAAQEECGNGFIVGGGDHESPCEECDRILAARAVLTKARGQA